MQFKKVEINKVKDFFKRLPWIAAERAFFTFLVLVFLALVFVSFLFYQYSILAQRVTLGEGERPAQFKKDLYQEILKEWQTREKKFEEADSKQYIDPFQEARGIPKEVIDPEELVSESPSEFEGTTSLFEFYRIKGEKLPSLNERAKMWEEKGLGPVKEYIGSPYQNRKLLTELLK